MKAIDGSTLTDYSAADVKDQVSIQYEKPNSFILNGDHVPDVSVDVQFVDQISGDTSQIVTVLFLARENEKPLAGNGGQAIWCDGVDDYAGT